ncbi:hypothetical protein [Microvirga sp. TS319]|uniref:hypothetical protein n=1 Tax=Microvirga sp. TS319 TaxID=3241165 RepID=UPI00351A4C0B
MLPADKGIRDLLPFIQPYLDDDVLLEADFDGAPIMEETGSPSTVATAAHPLADLSPHHEDDAGGRASMPIKAAPHSSAPLHVSALERGEAEHAQVETSGGTPTIELPKPIATSGDRGAGGHLPRGNAQEEHERDGHERDGDDDAHTINREPVGPSTPAGDAAEHDDAHTISVTQVAEVDQDAHVIVQGYVGKVVARLHIDQDLLMDQDADIDIDIDGEGRFFVTVDQDMRIDQSVDIDLRIFDVDDVLYVDLFLKDRIAVEQNTTLDIHLSDGHRGGDVSIDQSLEMNQDVDIDIDIEDDLEERYVVKVEIDVDQDAVADQDATVDITDRAGEIDMDVDALQTAYVDQETTVRIDFATI